MSGTRSAHPAEQVTVRRACERARRRAGRDAQPLEVQGEGRRGVGNAARSEYGKYGDAAVADGRGAGRQGAVDGPRRPDADRRRSTNAGTRSRWWSTRAARRSSRWSRRPSTSRRTSTASPASNAPSSRCTPAVERVLMGRNILFITTDQQRYDALGCNGGQIARTPVVDALAANGISYERAYNQNTVCMPARSTMLTGQYVRTHGVVANGVPLPDDAPSIAAYLHERAGLPHRAARQGVTSSPGSTASSSGPRTSCRSAGSSVRTAASSTPSSRCTCPTFGKRRAAALREVARRHARLRRRRRGSRRCSRPSPAATPARPRRASTRSRATGTTPTGSPIARSPTSTRSATTTTGSCGCRSRTRTTRGTRPSSELHRCDWRDLDLPRRSSRVRPRRSSASLAGEARALARAVAGQLRQRRRRPGVRTGRRTSVPTASARSTR